PAILMKAPPSAGDREHQIRFGFGANVEPNLHAPFEARFGFPLVEAWAMTETGAGACIAANRQPRRVGAKSIGRPGEELDVRIAGDDGSPVGDGPGELLVRRRGGDPRFGFFSRYHKDPGATEAAWRGGWFHTGDMVRREGQDLLFVDRAKNVIRRSGENIAAVEVEAVLVAQDGVRAVAVAPVEDALRGEEVCALVVAERADAAFAAELVGHALSEMAYYKVPGHVAFVDALPLTATQKVDRRALRAMAAASLRDGVAHDTRSLKGRSR
ncbi:MAG: AMP-binding protein, partial [Pseudomonadota bacterium]